MELTLTDFVLFTLVGSLVMVLAFTLISRTLQRRAEARSAAKRVICRLCLHAFEDGGHADITHCPHCGAANEKGRSRRLG